VKEEKIRVNLGSRSYDILIGFGNLCTLGEKIRGLVPGKKVAVISNDAIWGIYGKTVMASLEKAGFAVHYMAVPAGEKAKTMASAEKICEELVDSSFDRQCAVLALGGGVVGDLAGFVAAVYMRGIHFIQVPTSLLAQVDSSVGGKVAVNLSSGKNLVGAFYQPKLVLIDLDVLSTLPPREFTCGLAEVIKYGVIRDAEFFEYLEKHHREIQQKQADEILYIVKRSCQIKADVVEHDERESGLRAILNFGHTFAHVIELMAGYGTVTHGEAVGVGMLYAARLSNDMGLCDSSTVERIDNILEKNNLSRTFDFGDSGDVLKLFYRDKKVENTTLKFVLTECIGSVTISDKVMEGALIDLLLQDVI